MNIFPFSFYPRKSGTSTWQWFAYGKHPAAKDYFSLGDNFICKALAGWIEKSYPLAREAGALSGMCSWRFWAKGSGKGELICGLIKDSADAVGRPFPFMIAGIGIMKDWEQNWDMLGAACENAWTQMEAMASRDSKNLEQLLKEMHKIKPPNANWPPLLAERKTARDEYEVFKVGAVNIRSAWDDNDQTFCTLLNGADALQKSHFWHWFFRSRTTSIPGSVFTGGGSKQSYVGFFLRPLVTRDFVRLWTLCSE